MWAKLTLIAAIGALAASALAFPAGALIAGPTVTAWEISPHDPAQIDLNRELFRLERPGFDPATADPADPVLRDAVIAIYGNRGTEPQEFIWLEESDVIRPAEMPSLALVAQDYEATGKRWKASFVWFFVPKVAGGAAVVGLLLLGAWFWLRRRGPAPAAA